MGIIELNLSIDGKMPSSSERLKRIQREQDIIDLIWNRNSPERPSGPTDLIPSSLDNFLKTSIKFIETLLGKSEGKMLIFGRVKGRKI